MFSGLRQGNVLYVLDKTEEPKVVTGYVDTISAPHPLYTPHNPAAMLGTNMQSVVDVVVKVGNDRKEFIGIPSNGTIHSYGNYVICETKESMIQEVDAMLLNSKNILDSIELHKANVASYEKILKELNPVYAKEQLRDEAIDSLTELVNSMLSVLSRLEAMLTRLNQ